MRVLISGAGVAGPTLAWHLSRGLNAQVTVVERAADFLAQGQNVDLHGTALRIMRQMGTYDELIRNNTTEVGTRMVDQHGRIIAQLPVYIPGTNIPSPSPTNKYEILRGDLARIIYEATTSDNNITYRFNTTVDTVLDNGQDNVKVRLSDGQTETYDILVAADGQWSRIRKQLFAPEDLQVVDFSLFCCYWTAPRQPHDDRWWNIYHATRSRILMLRPDPHNTIRASLTKRPCNEAEKEQWQQAARSGDRQRQMDLIQADFADAGWQASRMLPTMASATDFYFQAVSQIRLRRWHVGRVICLGDAAYAPTPLTGMGSSLAILGAYCLAGELSRLPKGQHPSKAFTAYEAALRPFVEEIQQVPSFAPKIMHPQSRVGVTILRWVFWTLSKVVTRPFVARRLQPDDDAEDFKLPTYPDLEAVSVWTPASEKGTVEKTVA